MKKVLFLILLIISFYSSYGINNEKDTVVNAPEKESIKVELLEKQNIELKEQKSEIVEILKWSIGSIIIIIIALFGSSFYFNFRLSKKELDNVNKGIELDIKNQKIEFEKFLNEKIIEFNDKNKENIDKINSSFNELVKEINSSIKKDNSSLIDRFQNQLDEFNSNYRQQIKTIEKSFNSQIKSTQQLFENEKEVLFEKIESNSKKIESNNSNLQKEINYTEKTIRASIQRNAGYYWETTGVLSNSLRSYMNECNIYLDLDKVSMVELSLNNIKQIVEKLKSIDNYDKKELDTLLERIPSKYNSMKINIQELVGKII